MSYSKIQKPTIHDIVLYKQPFAASVAVSHEMLDLGRFHMDKMVLTSGQFIEYSDELWARLIYTLKVDLLRSPKTEKRTFSIEVPRTWWDHLKHDFNQSPKRWQRIVASWFSAPRYRTESKEFEVTIRVCPHNDSYLSEDKNYVHIHWLTWEGETYDDKL